VLSICDLRGRLPLHCAAQCPWVDERMIRTLVNIPWRVTGSKLQRAVTSADSQSNKNYGIWTNVDVIRQMRSDSTDESDVFVIQVLPIKDARTAFSRKTDRPMNYSIHDNPTTHRMRRMSSQRDDNIKELNHRMATQHDNLSPLKMK